MKALKVICRRLFELIVLMMPLLMISGEDALAQSNEAVTNLRNERNAAMSNLAKSLEELEADIETLNRQIAEQKVLRSEAEEKRKNLERLHKEITAELTSSNEKYKEIANDYKRNKFTEKTKHVLPIVAGIASGFSAGDDPGEGVMIGFGVFGALLFLEDLGIGLGKPISKVLFPIFD